MKDDWVCSCGGEIVVGGGISYMDGHIGGDGFCKKCGVGRYVRSFPPEWHEEIMGLISKWQKGEVSYG